jgi:predicted Zn-dependent peptidase
MTYPSGSASEQAGESGAALAAKHMAFKSSATSSSARILYDLENAGASPFSSVSRFSSTNGYTCAPEQAAGLLEMLSTPSAYELWDMRDARAYAALDKAEMMQTPETALSDIIYAAAYGEKTAAGKSLYQTVSNEGIISFMGRELVGGTLVATGVSDHKAFVAAASSAFASSTGGTPSAPSAFTSGESRLPAATPYSHVAVAFAAADSNAVNAVVKALLNAGSGSSVAGFTAEGLVGAYGSR